LAGSPIKARLYVTALGLYEFHINGHRIGNQELAPGWTDYRKRVRYQVYDVGGLLAAGENVLGAIVGDGWYCGHIGWRDRQFYGDRPKLLAQLELEFLDGTKLTVATDETWRTTTGPILESDLLMGESYDARFSLDGWDASGYEDASWAGVELFPKPDCLVVPTMEPPIRVTQFIEPIAEPKAIAGWEASECIFDLGQNMVGRARFTLHGKRGQTVRIRYAEILDEKGAIYVANLRGARCTDYYTFATDGEDEVFEPRFTFHGFRYIELRGLTYTPSRDAVVGVVLHSDNTLIGSFECSDPQINQLQKNIDWGWRGNSLDVPTDCPQRDERLGWTGDAQVFVRTACFNRDVAAFFGKYSQDMEDGQGPLGQIPMVLPSMDFGGNDGGPAWADAVIICPWTIYQCYGDTGILRAHYQSMTRFLASLKDRSRDGVRSYRGMDGFSGFGDWLNIQAETPQELIGTAFYAYCASLMAEIAGVLNEASDAAEFQALFEAERAAFQRHFVTPAGRLCSETQTAYLLALHFKLLPAELRAAALESLVYDIEKRGFKLSTGFVGSPYLNHVLTEGGRSDVAFKLLHQTAWPSWLYAVTQGATTIWERWDGWTHDKGFQDVGMNSFNHYAYGAIGAWLYQSVAGIDLDPSGPGYRRSVLAPNPGDLSSAKAHLLTPYGLLKSEWNREGGKFTWQFTIPANTSSRVRVPVARELVPTTEGMEFKSEDDHGTWFEVGPGEYSVVAVLSNSSYRS
jgi:alpha-L-rhamnosidase